MLLRMRNATEYALGNIPGRARTSARTGPAKRAFREARRKPLMSLDEGEGVVIAHPAHCASGLPRDLRPLEPP